MGGARSSCITELELPVQLELEVCGGSDSCGSLVGSALW